MPRISGFRWSALTAVFALMVSAGGAGAQTLDRPQVLEDAEFVLSEARRPPDDNAGWTRVKLPDNWHRTRPEFSGTGWYRLDFTLPPGPPRPQAIVVKRLDAQFQVVFINGNLIGAGGPRGRKDLRTLARPERYAIPPALLRQGSNLIHVRVEGDAGLRHGLHRLIVGESAQVDPEFQRQFMIQIVSYNMLCAAAALSGLIALAFWFRERRQRTLLWFAITAFTWAAMYWPWFVSVSLSEVAMVRRAMSFLLSFAYAAPMMVLCIRMANRQLPVLEAGIWLFTLTGLVAAVYFGAAVAGTLITWWSGAYLVLLFALLFPLLLADRRHRDLSFWLLAAAAVAAVVLNAHDLGRWLGWIDFENPRLSLFQAPLVLFALGARVVSHHFRALDEVERSRAELESRVAEKAREIEAAHARLREVERAEALAGERRRIMTDMHDGVGASLVGLLGEVQAGNANPREIQRRLHETLQELRLAVDALEPVNGDLAAVLGGVRHRLRPAIEESGVELDWQVGDLPRLTYLTPQVILQVQRIVLEAMMNALRHAHARRLRIATSVDRLAAALQVRVEDDGTGFDTAAVSGGRGLASMRSRAASMGGSLELRAQPSGTAVILRLPLDGAPAADPRGEGI